MGELSPGNCWEPLHFDPGHTFHTCSALQEEGYYAHFTKVPDFLMCFFRGSFVPLQSSPCTWQLI